MVLLCAIVIEARARVLSSLEFTHALRQFSASTNILGLVNNLRWFRLYLWFRLVAPFSSILHIAFSDVMGQAFHHGRDARFDLLKGIDFL